MAQETVGGTSSACYECNDNNCNAIAAHFLDVLPADVQLEAVRLIHELCKSDFHREDAKEKCTKIIVKIENDLEVDHIICELMLKVFAELLMDHKAVDEGIDLINEHMKRKKSEDFGSLLLLVHILTLNADYRKSEEVIRQACQLAEKSEDSLLLCLCLAKEACIQWHLKNTEHAKANLSKCESILEKFDTTEKNNSLFCESIQRLLNIYKTLAYINHLFRNKSKAMEYYLKALKIVEQDGKARMNIIKIQTQIGSRYSENGQKEEAKKYYLKAYEELKEISLSKSLVSKHPLTVIKLLNKVAHSMQVIEENVDSLIVRELSYSIAEKHLSNNHPAVARVAADAAYLCNVMNQTIKENMFIERCKGVLDFYSDTSDRNFLKVHIRELSDACRFLAKVFVQRRDVIKSQKYFNEAISFNTRVYGGNHPRLITIYKSLGYLHKRFDKFSDAAVSFGKCVELMEEFTPNDTAAIKKVKREIKHVQAIERKKYGQYRCGDKK